MLEKSLKEEIILKIGSSSSDYRKDLANRIIESKIPIFKLMDILLDVHPISTRFSWLLGEISDQDSSYSKEIIDECFMKLNLVKVKNFDRSLSKQIMICGKNLPSELEGRIVDKLFEWLNDAKITVSTKNNSLFALESLSEKYPELKGELIETINTQKELNTLSFNKRAEKVLKRLMK